MSEKSRQYALPENYLTLAIGNSRLHWAWFNNNYLIETWDNQHLSKPVLSEQISNSLLSKNLARKNLNLINIYLASVVPKQTEFWLNYVNSHVIDRKNIKLKNIYSTLGIDRALALWGGGETYGYPCLVIDGGTALTLTGVNRQQELIGGAILPGLRSQFLNLKQKTAALPKVELSETLPPRWANNTEGAIASGIIHTTIAGIYSYISDWQRQYPDSQIVFTGGDGKILTQYFQQQYPDLRSRVKSDRNLIFYGMKLAIMQL